MAFSQRVLRLCFRRYTPRFFYEFPRPLATASSHSHSHSHRRSHSHGHGHGLFSLSVASSASAAFLFSQSLLSAEPHKYVYIYMFLPRNFVLFCFISLILWAEVVSKRALNPQKWMHSKQKTLGIKGFPDAWPDLKIDGCVPYERMNKKYMLANWKLL